jgi:acyl-CoA synthetase (NDP forming)
MPVLTATDPTAMEEILRSAYGAGRMFLWEHEVYAMLRHMGAETIPQARFFPRGSRPGDEELLGLPGTQVVLKIVHPAILHKSDVGGVQILPAQPDTLRAGIRRLPYLVAEASAQRLESQPAGIPRRYADLSHEELVQALLQDTAGVLAVQWMPRDSESVGSELLVGLRQTREFGAVLTAGVGGTDTELFAAGLRPGCGVVSAAAHLTSGGEFFALFRQTLSYQILAGKTRAQKRLVSDEQLEECFAAMIATARYFSEDGPGEFIVEELEINPFAFHDFMMIPLDGMCRFRPKTLRRRPPRPQEHIHSLLHPRRIALAGVSASRPNFGRTILANVLGMGFAPEDVTILHPHAQSIDGVACVPTLAQCPSPLDLLVVAVPAREVPRLLDEVLSGPPIAGVLLIPGGLGETEDSKDFAQTLRGRIDAARSSGHAPVILGANSMGVISQPGRYDTWFLPGHNLPRGTGKTRCAFISQSGAFMATRLRRFPELDPTYAISMGNQTDLTLGDIMTYLAGHPNLDVLAVYAEGFDDGDGLAFAKATRQAVLEGKEVIVYKAGRTPEGKSATSSHTASLAGDYAVAEACLAQAGALVARELGEFTGLFRLAQVLHGKTVTGNRIAALSSAGYEAVAMADAIHGEDYALRLARLAPATQQAIAGILQAHGLESLVTPSNPLDLTPGASEAVFAGALDALAADEGVDAIVLGLIPLNPSFSPPATQRFLDELVTLAHRSPKPLVVVVDGDTACPDISQRLRQAGLAVFNSADQAVRCLGRYLCARLAAGRLRQSAEFMDLPAATHAGQHPERPPYPDLLGPKP